MPAATSQAAIAYQHARQTRIQAARRSPKAFIEYVMRDEETHGGVRLAPMHEEWQDLITRHPRLIIWAHIGSGKTQSISIGRVLWELGRDPTLRIGIVSDTHEQAAKIVQTIGQYIKSSRELAEVFPGLRPGSPWKSDAITVRRPTFAKEPSVKAWGYRGPIRGARLDFLILDDYEDYERARTEYQRERGHEWLKAEVFGRESLTKGMRIVMVTTANHTDDAPHRISREPGWTSRRFPIQDAEGRSSWPSRWTPEKIAAKRAELGPFQAARQLDVVAVADETARFKEAWIQVALDRGRGQPFLQYLQNRMPGEVVIGVDLGVSEKPGADLTAFATALIHPNKDRQLLNLETGRWAGPDIVDRLVKLHRRFGANVVVVEGVAAQSYILQFTRKLADVPVIPFMTGRDKMSLDWQIEALATEMSEGRWILPCDQDGKPIAAEVRELVKDLVAYSPVDHCPDRVAALAFARWGAEKGDQRMEVGRINLGPR